MNTLVRERDAFTLDAVSTVGESEAVVKTVKAAKPWLLWTGVIGALFALLAMAAILVLSQKLEAQAQTLAQLEVVAKQPQEMVIKLRQEILDELAQQRLTQQNLAQQQKELVVSIERLARQKEAGWQLTDASVVKFMLVELKATSLLNPDSARLSHFLRQWQSELSQSGISRDHALMQALDSESNALRTDVPNWQSESDAWHALQTDLATIKQEVGSKQAQEVTSDTSGDLWQKLSALVRIRPAGMSENELSQTVSQRIIWPVQAALALEVVQVGLLSNQPLLVNQVSTQLLTLLSQQAPDLLPKWQSRLLLWQTWQGMVQPEWHYLQNYIQQQGENVR
jgi:hypothetical protein